MSGGGVCTWWGEGDFVACVFVRGCCRLAVPGFCGGLLNANLGAGEGVGGTVISGFVGSSFTSSLLPLCVV